MTEDQTIDPYSDLPPVDTGAGPGGVSTLTEEDVTEAM